MRRRFRQVDVFADTPYLGNPLAVVIDGDGLTQAQMQRFAAWTNLSETTFLQRPTDPAADYRARIFDPANELPFAGHPTLGSCHAWLEAGGEPRDPDRIVQECEAGLVEIRRTGDGLAFAAPPTFRDGPPDEATIQRIADVLRIARSEIVDAQWVANGPNWVAALLPSAEAVLALTPGFVDFDLGVVGPYPPGSDSAVEVRAFFEKDGATAEDPVTGSLNAGLAPWLAGTGRVAFPYTAAQGTRLGREGRVRLTRDAAGTVWVAGRVVTCISGEVEL